MINKFKIFIIFKFLILFKEPVIKLSIQIILLLLFFNNSLIKCLPINPPPNLNIYFIIHVIL